MKQKLLIGFIASIISSTNIFALEIYKGHLVKREESITEGAKLTFKQGDLKQLISSKISRDSNTFSAFVASSINQTTGKVGEITNISANDYVEAKNVCGATETYLYEFIICVDMTDRISRCGSYREYISLDNGGYVRGATDPTLIVKFDKSGSYRIRAVASLTSAESAHYRKNHSYNVSAQSASSSTIEIA